MSIHGRHPAGYQETGQNDTEDESGCNTSRKIEEMWGTQVSAPEGGDAGTGKGGMCLLAYSRGRRKARESGPALSGPIDPGRIPNVPWTFPRAGSLSRNGLRTCGRGHFPTPNRKLPDPLMPLSAQSQPSVEEIVAVGKRSGYMIWRVPA